MKLILWLSFAVALKGPAQVMPASSPRPAVERGLRFLQQEAFRWKQTRHCAACHHAATMIWSFNEARARGYAVDEKALNEITSWAFGDMKTNSLTPEPPPRDMINLGWVYLLLSVERAPWPKSRRESTTLAASGSDYREPGMLLAARQTLLDQIISKQTADGSWGRPLDLRVPLGGPTEDIAILSRLALVESGDASQLATDSIDKATKWLAANHDQTSRQARNLRLLTDSYEHKPTAELKSVISSIEAEQNADGGWSQTPEMSSDAYATGQTLYVLARAGIRADTMEIRRGVEFLTHTQHEDGSWPMISRVHAKNLDPITATGTAWAVLGLIRTSH